jgi:hypothetical protein
MVLGTGVEHPDQPRRGRVERPLRHLLDRRRDRLAGRPLVRDAAAEGPRRTPRTPRPPGACPAPCSCRAAACPPAAPAAAALATSALISSSVWNLRVSRSMRAAMLTASDTTVDSSRPAAPTSPRITGPECTPTPTPVPSLRRLRDHPEPRHHRLRRRLREQRHQPVPEVLVDHPAARLDLRHDLREEPVQKFIRRRRPLLLGPARELPQVDEHHRHLALDLIAQLRRRRVAPQQLEQLRRHEPRERPRQRRVTRQQPMVVERHRRVCAEQLDQPPVPRPELAEPLHEHRRPHLLVAEDPEQAVRARSHRPVRAQHK